MHKTLMPDNNHIGAAHWVTLVTLFLFTSLIEINWAYANNPSFDECIRQIKTKVAAQGITNKTITQVFNSVRHIPRVIELDNQQPEFTQSFANYFNKRVSITRIKAGQALLIKHRKLLSQIKAETGIPPHYLLAFWGLETNYGGYLGKTSTLSALATLACDQRRSTFFTKEFINALRIIDSGDITPEQMRGSWAGAMGHMQFMPTTYLKYAQDGDGDGRQNLWRSIPDALLSAGNFLKQLGWDPDLDWGQEVQPPTSFNYLLAGRNHTLKLADWAKLNIVTTSGAPLTPTEQQAQLIVPSGHEGPAFLVTKNFDTIMRWNQSEFYALAVGLLADRIAGAPPLHRSPPTTNQQISRQQIYQLQQDLTTLGNDVGEIDGILGPKTRKALSHFQDKTQRVADGYLDTELLKAIHKAAIEQSRPIK